MEPNPYEAPKEAEQASVHIGLLTLLIVLAVQIPLTWIAFRSAAGVAIFAVVTIVTWLSFWPERRFRREIAERESLDDARFLQEFYADRQIPSDIPLRLRPIYCKFFEIEVGKLRPQDRPPEIVELDTVDLIRDIETEFGVKISDEDAEQIDGSFDSIVRYLAKSVSRHATSDGEA